MPHSTDIFRGILLGTAVGDALGLPLEGVSRRRVARLTRNRWRHRLIFGRGMISDDTEHTLFVAQALLAHPTSVEGFTHRLAWALRGWLLSLPAGIGWATLKAIFRLWIGMPPERSGVWSAGNGPAMRIAPIGAFFAHDAAMRKAYTTAATRMTHTDPKALAGAGAVAELIAWMVRRAPQIRPSAGEFIQILRSAAPENDSWLSIVDSVADACRKRLTVAAFADCLGLSKGITGYIYHTVPVAVYAWWRHFGDFEATLISVLSCGGDTDTAGAITGALAGAVTGEKGIPDNWIAGITDWPRNTALLRKVADRLAEPDAEMRRPVPYFWPGSVARNLFFITVVLFHGFRRFLPPY